MNIAAVGKAFPPHYYDQETLLAALKGYWSEELFNPDRLERFHRNVAVGGRHLALPIEAYGELENWGDANRAWARVAEEVGAEAGRDALEKAGVDEKEVDHLIFTSVTGVAVPSIDARLINRLGLRPDVKRVPVFGWGCLGGAAGVARQADYLTAFPDQTSLLVSVELCSLTLQLRDFSVANLISSGLFGDGAAAVVVCGRSKTENCPRIVATRSAFYTDTQEVMGWDISERGFQVVLSPEVPKMVRLHLRRDVDGFLAEQGLALDDISMWIAHPGGPKVLEAMEEALELDGEALARTRESLARVGNLSSTSVLLVLGEALDKDRPAAGTFGLLLALGPGFCSELVLLQW